jgi:nitrogen regulatory protein PII
MNSSQLIHEAREALKQRRGHEYVLAADVIVEALLDAVKYVAHTADLNDSKLAVTVIDSLVLIREITYKIHSHE